MPASKPSFPTLARGNPYAQGLVAGYPTYEGSGLTLNDLSGNGNNGTLVGGATWSAGQSGWSIKLDGSTGYVSVASSPSLPDGSAPFSAACWFSPTLGANNRGLVTRTSGFSTGIAGWRFNYQGTGTLRLDTSVTQVNSTFTMTSGVWQHVAVTVSAGTVTFYLNGATEAHAASVLGTANTSSPLLLGTFFNTSGLATGLLDAPAVYNRPLSAAEVAALYADSWRIYRRRAAVLKPAAAVPDTFPSWYATRWLFEEQPEEVLYS